MFKKFFIIKCWKTRDHHPSLLPVLPQTLKRRRMIDFPCFSIFHIEWRTCNSPLGLNFKLSLRMWFTLFPEHSYFLLPAGPTDSSNLYTSATNMALVPESPLPPFFSQASNFQSPNSFAPRILQRGTGQGRGLEPCFQSIWNTTVNCSFLLLLWHRWPYRVARLETNTDQCAVVALVRRGQSMLSLCPLVPRSSKRVLPLNI